LIKPKTKDKTIFRQKYFGRSTRIKSARGRSGLPQGFGFQLV
jgi:hypothetical protein